MPKLIDTTRRTTKKLDLPSSTKEDPAWVEVYVEALSGDVEQMANAGEQRGLAMITGIVNIIKDWNFQKEDGTKEDITLDNVRRLSQKDLTFILSNVDAYNELAGIGNAQKKSLATTSLPKQ
jgi:hypothetical protein